MIKSFRDKRTEAVFAQIIPKRMDPKLARAALVKLLMLDAAPSLDTLRVPNNKPGNQVKKLKGDRKGQRSIRINDQFRLCFRWIDGHAHDVELVDYH